MLAASSGDSQPCLCMFLRVLRGSKNSHSLAISKLVLGYKINDENIMGCRNRVKDESSGWMETDGYLSLICRANNVSFFGGEHMFFELIQNCSLEYLNLSRSFLSHNEVKILCDILIQTECHMDQLV